jgi:hypothetical protein
MNTDKTRKYNEEVYKAMADLYVIEKLSLASACAKIGISIRNYYKICKKLGFQSVTTYKDARLNFISKDNNIDEHNSIN